MNSPSTFYSLDYRTSNYRLLPGIVSGGGNIKLLPSSQLKQATPDELKQFPLLPMKLIKKFIPLADYYGISEKARGLKKPTTSDYGFIPVYETVGAKKLNQVPAKISVPNGISMEKKRIVAIKSKLGQIKSMHIPLYHTSGELNGLPTKMHTILIMWGFSPQPQHIKQIKIPKM